MPGLPVIEFRNLSSATYNTIVLGGIVHTSDIKIRRFARRHQFLFDTYFGILEKCVFPLRDRRDLRDREGRSAWDVRWLAYAKNSIRREMEGEGQSKSLQERKIKVRPIVTALRCTTSRRRRRRPLPFLFRYTFIPGDGGRSFRRRRRSWRREEPENETVTPLSRLSSSWTSLPTKPREKALLISPLTGFSHGFTFLFPPSRLLRLCFRYIKRAKSPTAPASRIISLTANVSR